MLSKINVNQLMISRKRTYRIILVTLVLLLIPLVAMQFTSEVAWTIGDFFVGAILLIVAGYFFEVSIKGSKSQAFKIIIGLVVLIGLLLIWAELAVGIF